MTPEYEYPSQSSTSKKFQGRLDTCWTSS